VASSNIDSICPGDPVIISFTPSAGAGPPYTVTGSNGDIITSPYTYYPPYTTNFVVTATDLCNQPASEGIPIHVYIPPPNAFLADTLSGCQPFTVQFNEINPDSGQTYVWDFGDYTNLSLDKNPIHVYKDPGVFDVTLSVTSVDGCKNVKGVDTLITVFPKPNALFTYDPSVVSILNPTVNFNNMSDYGYEYMWSFGTSDSSSHMNPAYIFPEVGTYPVCLITISEFGCRDTAGATVLVRDEVTFFAPTAFSPDNDGVNDLFFVLGHGITPAAYRLIIYDRWGQIMWETNKWSPDSPESCGWDGKNKAGKTVKIGTYTWLCIFYDSNGLRYEKAGTVTVLW
jgi:gliding motility-associated-like protein